MLGHWQDAQLPPVNYLDMKIQMPKKAMNQYHAYKRERVLSIKDDTLLAANAGVLCGQLLQMTSGEIYTKDDNGNHTGTARIHAAKIWALDDLIQQANGQPVIVFYYFQHERDRILKHFADSKEPIEARELRTADDIRDWNAGKIEVLLLHPASAGHGLNLQAGGHIAIWYTMPNWNLELYQQANARIYRQGQKQPVTIYRIIAEGTIDEDMEDGQQFPVDWPPTDVTIITNPRKQQNCRPYCLPSGRIVQARKPEKAELSVQAYVPHQLTCEVYNRKTG